MERLAATRCGVCAMDGIHDLGGLEGFGAVVRERDEPVFHAPWEGRAFALVNLALALGVANIDALRHAIERLDPVTYLTAGYYGRWRRALETLLGETGIVPAAELAVRLRDPAAPAAALTSRPVPPAELGARRPLARAPRFSPGDRVRARDLHTRGHTRLPRYARGRSGVVALVHPGAWVLPDAHAHGRGEAAQPVYAVRFEARALWGDEAEAGVAFHVDLFEDYLEPAA